MNTKFTSLEASHFSDFFQQLYPYPPMNWQTELAESACEGQWPEFISLPTGAGKTSTVDIAIFALAFQASLKPTQRTAPMRTFLVVDRRTVVSDAFHRAIELQKRLETATDGILKTVADRLLSFTDGLNDSKPLSVVQMRGGIYRDRNWCNSLTQPMIITSTVDQVGSRLLFRGYGVSNLARPMQATVVAHDSLIILDEAHISPAFSSTLKHVQNFQQSPWCEVANPKALRVIEMTATPPTEANSRKMEIRPEELADTSTHIGRIVNTRKSASLVVADKAKGVKAPEQIASVLVEQAMKRLSAQATEKLTGRESSSLPKFPVVGIMCNMVASAKATFELLLKHKSVTETQVELIIGAMRPLDRETQTNKLRTLIATGSPRDQIDQPIFVVATQCIEVGADYDFDILITEAAPLDSLIQRFGRLNRAGREIPAIGCIVMRGDHIKTDKQLEVEDEAFRNVDPVYGNSKSYAWNWLTEIAQMETVDFGIANFNRQTALLSEEAREKLSSDKNSGPVLLPAHLDMLCQTTVDPWPDPDISLWLHGPHRNDPEVQVCWRSDLLPPASPSKSHGNCVTVSLLPFKEPDRHEDLVHTISLCPPTTAECLSVPLRRVVAWLKATANQKKVAADTSGDIPQLVEDAVTEEQSISAPFQPVAWRGTEKSMVVSDVRDIHPGDTLVFSPLAGGWTELGYVPKFHNWNYRDEKGSPFDLRMSEINQSNVTAITCNADDFEKLAEIDVGSLANCQSRNRPIVRLHPNLIPRPQLQTLFDKIKSEGGEVIRKQELKVFLDEINTSSVVCFPNFPSSILKMEFYPNRDGIVVTGPRFNSEVDYETIEDDGSDVFCSIVAGQPIELAGHLGRVRAETERSADAIGLIVLARTLSKAADIHDWGKADPRFQALLLGGDLFSALWEEQLVAKSAKMPISFKEQTAASRTLKIPKHFRHEMLSLALAETYLEQLGDIEDAQLMLHLIASHHGYARPWAPFCDDVEVPEVGLEKIGLPSISITSVDRKQQCHEYYRFDSSVPKRFWYVVRKYGWWGAAALESVLRFADQRVSQIEGQKQAANANRQSHLTVN